MNSENVTSTKEAMVRSCTSMENTAAILKTQALNMRKQAQQLEVQAEALIASSNNIKKALIREEHGEEMSKTNASNASRKNRPIILTTPLTEMSNEISLEDILASIFG